MSEPDLMADTSVWDVAGRPSPVQTIYDSLNQSLGTAYDTTDTSNVTADTKAAARVLAAAWRTNRRMLLQWDPRYMDDFVPRWEAIFGIHPASGANLATRQAVLQSRFLILAGRASLTDTVTAILGANLVGIIFTSLTDDVARWPENGFPDLWTSNVAHILIRVQFVGGESEASFLAKITSLSDVLNDMLPAYTTWDWATYDEAGVEGYFLDEAVGAGPPPNNTLYESFDV